MSNEKPHPLIFSCNCSASELLEPFYAIKPLNLHDEKETIQAILEKAMENTLNLSFDNFPSLDHAYATITIAGWLSHQKQFTQIENRLRFSFEIAVLNYLQQHPEISPAFIKSVFGKDAYKKDNGFLIIPLNGITKNIPISRDNYIQDQCLYIPPHVYMDLLPEHIIVSFDNIIQGFDNYIDIPLKNDVSMIFADIIESIRIYGIENGPWLLYENHTHPLSKFAVDILIDPIGRQTYSFADVLDIISEYTPVHTWDTQFKEKLSSMKEEELANFYKKADYSRKHPEIEYVSDHTITITKNTKVTLTTLDDIEKLQIFPCINKIFTEEKPPHKIIISFISILLWFYSKDECHYILNKKLKFKNYDRAKTEKHINSLIDIDKLPKYFSGTNGFGKYCIGYQNCEKCWIKYIRFPENYYSKKRESRENYYKSQSTGSTPCSILPKTISI